MHAQPSLLSTNAAVATPPGRPQDLQARLHATGPLSQEEFDHLRSLHQRVLPPMAEHPQQPGIAWHVLPEGWGKAE